MSPQVRAVPDSAGAWIGAVVLARVFSGSDRGSAISMTGALVTVLQDRKPEGPPQNTWTSLSGEARQSTETGTREWVQHVPRDEAAGNTRQEQWPS